LLQEEYQRHEVEVAKMKHDHSQFESLMNHTIDQFRNSTISTLKGYVDKINILTLENARLQAENTKLLCNIMPTEEL